MESNRQNKLFQQKMEELTELPEGFSFEATSGWNKLETRLTCKKTKNKAPWWMMAAAASVVLILSLLFLMLPSKQVQTVKQTVTPLTTTPVVAVKQDTKTTTINSLPTQIKTSTLKINTAKKQTVKNKNIIPVNEHNLPDIALQQTPPVTETVKPEERTAAAPTAPGAITSPKRRIIHINELLQEYHLEQQRVAEAKRNQKPVEEEVSTEKNPESFKPWYKKSKHILTIKNQ